MGQRIKWGLRLRGVGMGLSVAAPAAIGGLAGLAPVTHGGPGWAVSGEAK
jgi:hypothetical protein